MIFRTILVTVFCSAIACYCYGSIQSLRLVDDYLYCLKLQSNKKSASSDLVLVEIDDKSIAALGAFPWNRSIFARLVDLVSAQPKSVVALDIIFENDNHDPGDDALAAVAAARKNVLFAQSLSLSPDPDARLYPSLRNSNPTVGIVQQDSSNLSPVSGLSTFRASYPVEQAEVSSLVTAAFCMWARSTQSISDCPTWIAQYVGNFSVHPTNPRLFVRQIPINYLGDGQGFKHVSFIDVLRTPELFDFKGKVVLIGITTNQISDDVATPRNAIHGGMTKGVLVLANAINTLMQGKMIKAFPLELVFVAAFIVTFFGLQFKPRALNYLTWSFLLATSCVVASWVLFQVANFQLVVIPIAIALCLGSGVSSFLNWFGSHGFDEGADAEREAKRPA